MDEWKVPLFKIFHTTEDINSVVNNIKMGANWATGPDVGKFEDEINQFINSKYAVTFNSGTSALHAALSAYGIGKGHEVIVPSFTFISTANAPLFVDAKPIFADIEENTYGLDPESVVESITDKTKAIIPIHYGGCPCDIVSLREIADDYNLVLIEDSAEAFGAEVNGEKVGTFGDSSMFSFCQNKIITTGEGGAITTDSKEIYEKLKLIRSHGRLESHDYFSSTELFDYVTLGYNFRLSNISASLGRSQLKMIDEIINMRRNNARYLMSALDNLSSIKISVPQENYFHVYQMFTIYVNEYRDELMNHLKEKGIFTKVYFSPVHLTHFYKQVLGYNPNLPITENVSDHVLTLPMYPNLSKSEMDYMVSQIQKFFEVGL
ncbi:perosamine synthetase [Methanohalophilus levihalophilus]|uniref:DegT/DnrJ/EryC1/StrS family aminotransferase n=1 Tax=Methanohalophilus levihalophilus TaxID=1431282 RepID=UPI001AE44CAE|nr:DegT/DnrJ/EryC1/StrS family aminotransferase [Methanohalophilus levihalophilus]MBP2029953.1 perosamine synthetase [Methanohalophilus levihalophilus]